MGRSVETRLAEHQSNDIMQELLKSASIESKYFLTLISLILVSTHQHNALTMEYLLMIATDILRVIQKFFLCIYNNVT